MPEPTEPRPTWALPVACCLWWGRPWSVDRYGIFWIGWHSGPIGGGTLTAWSAVTPAEVTT